jgi:hypothetical protein
LSIILTELNRASPNPEFHNLKYTQYTKQETRVEKKSGFFYALLVQLVEQLPCKEKVIGSRPVESSKRKRSLTY